MNGLIFDIKEMAIHDGPGIRTTVFFKGCPLSCIWCHNPEGLSFKKDLMFKYNSCTDCGLCFNKCNHSDCKTFNRCLHICPNNCLETVGKIVDSKELAERLIKNAEILGSNFGGFTFSGGEPLAQSEFLIDLLDRLKNYHLCIETSGYADSNVFKNVISRLDYVIMDIKIADNAEHKKYTGVFNNKILDNFNILYNSGKPFIIRTPIIKNITDSVENLSEIQRIIKDSNWEKLEYNAAAEHKYKMLGIDFKMKKA